jgi:hypothetical protein
MQSHRVALSLMIATCLMACGNETSSGSGGGSSGGSSGQVGTGGDGDTGGSGGTAGTAGIAGSGGSGGSGGSVEPGTCGTDPSAVRSWCDAATWGGSVPTSTTDVVITGEVVVDCAAQAGSIDIPAGARLKAARTTDSTLTVHGNLVVRGTLDYGTPESRICNATAEIIFQGMDDQAFQGTPNPFPFEGGTPGVFPEPKEIPLEVVDSDYGVWVVDSGVFTAAGAAKRAWSKLTETTGPGDATFSVEDASGWLAGDRVVLTPTAESSVSEHYLQFDEAVVLSVDANNVTLESAPAHEHLGCTDCLRRGEAANLNRSVVVRSFDDTAHAHIMVAHSGLLQLDSVELRWLGPKKECSRQEPFRRSPIHFHQQEDASDASFVRHVAIWGGNHHFLMQEKSNGVEVNDVAGYDTIGVGFSLFFDNSTCNTRCSAIEDWAPRNTVFTNVLAAKVAVPQRDDCNEIGGVVAISPSGGEGSGCLGCVATGTAYNFGAFGIEGALLSAEGGAGRPLDFTLNNNVTHNNAGNGISNWQNTDVLQPAYDGNQTWSNGEDGVHHGAYGNAFEFTNITSIDNAGADFAVIAIQSDASRPRVDGATFDGFRTLPYFLVPTLPVVIKNASFTGARNPAITQVQDTCSGGNENDPEDGTCIRNWLRFENPEFPEGVQPFLFGWHANKHSLWEVRGFSHPDYPNLPANFDLYRRDNFVSGGSHHAEFDAWLVPR